MHQNLLNAEFASIEYLNARDKNMRVFGIMNALTRSRGNCREAFAAHMPAVNCTFRVKSYMCCKTRDFLLDEY
jgi:hypothetical protein